MDSLAAAGFGPFKISIVVTRHNVEQLDGFKALADGYGAQLRVTRLRPSGRGADSWAMLHPTADQQRDDLPMAARPRRRGAHRRLVLPPERPRRAAARPEPLRRRASGLPDRPGRRRLRLPVRDPRRVPGRQRSRDAGGFAAVWRSSDAVPLAAGAAVAGGLRVVRQLRRLPGRAAWRPSSSPACPSTAPTPSASRDMARPSSPASPLARRPPRCDTDHSTPVTFVRR